jgi:hypothetical protein
VTGYSIPEFLFTRRECISAEIRELSSLSPEFYDKPTGVKAEHQHVRVQETHCSGLDVGSCETILLETRSGNAAYGSSGISHAMATSSPKVICYSRKVTK